MEASAVADRAGRALDSAGQRVQVVNECAVPETNGPRATRSLPHVDRAGSPSLRQRHFAAPASGDVDAGRLISVAHGQRGWKSITKKHIVETKPTDVQFDILVW